MANILKCKFCEPVIDNFDILKAYLPGDYEYLVCSLMVSTSNFKTYIRTSGKNPEYAHKWLEDFQMHSKCTMRVERTYPHSGTKNIFKLDFRCQHNTRPRTEKVRDLVGKKDSCKNTDCPAKMGITIKRVVTERKSRSKDRHLPDYPTVIQMNFCHNHDILTPEILKHRSVHPDVKEKILGLFKLGHNPATALDMHKCDLLLEYGENFEKIAQDRAILPDSQYCYRLYYKILKKEPTDDDDPNDSSVNSSPSKTPLSNCENSSLLKSNEHEKKNKKKRKLEYSVFNKEEMSEQISAEMYKFCKAGGVAGMLHVDDNNSVMALCTPLMLRVHSYLKHSGDLVFVDTYGELGEPNSCRIYIFVTYSCVGALPMGCLVVTSATTSCIKIALDVWKQILPSGRFFFKTDGPDIFYTNDSEDEKQALKSCFPKSHVLICISHILQATWTFLIDRKNTIKKEHRSLLFSKVKMLLFSQSADELEMNYAYAVADNSVKSNAVFLEYLNHVYNHRHDWSLVYYRHLLSRADDLTVLWESAMIVLKDPILSRGRVYNQLQVLDILSRLDVYYERKLIDLVNSRFDSFRLSRFLLIDPPREAYTITQFSEVEYEVHNDTKDTVYQVDVSLGACECRTGKTGAPCKHQLLVFRNFSIPLYDCVPVNTPAEKNLLLLLATGHSVSNEPSPENAPEAVPTSITEMNPKMLYASTEIVIHELDSYNTNAIFLDDANINGSPILSELPPNSLVQPNPTVVQQPVAIENGQESIHRLLSNIEHSPSQQVPVSDEPPIVTDEPSIVSDEPPSHTVSQYQTVSQIETLVSSSSQTVSPGEPLVSSSSQTVLPNVSQMIDQICAELKERTAKSPGTFQPALQTFLKNLDKISGDSSLEYALYSFGKFSKSAVPFFKRKIADNKLIGLQSTGEESKKKRIAMKMLKNSQNKI